ncbi:Spy/CpxP family protein refolding chaperone [Candidatus Magnetomonas plexicatena]|uniref:Spy/CpxP family protein refolding chaperone n=1 Tax=Candidatus Magnetomonas plexicatena TaxID=2552947 RepID=UPI0011049FDF|nr:hypothetical protein E2O03_010390 [Nitrospirales bacterium LBB_01]
MKRKVISILVMLYFVVFAMAGSALAHNDDEGKSSDKKSDHKEMWKKHKAMMQEKMIKALGLDKETSGKLITIFDNYGKKRHELRHSFKSNIKELKEAVNKKDEAAMKDILGKMDEAHKELKNLMESEKGEINGLLTVQQQAKYALFKADFRKKMMGKHMKKDKS